MTKTVAKSPPSEMYTQKTVQKYFDNFDHTRPNPIHLTKSKTYVANVSI